MFLQFGEVVEGIGLIQFASMDQAHEQVPHLGTVLRLIEQTILSMQNAFLQSPLDEVRIQRRARLAEEQGQPSP